MSSTAWLQQQYVEKLKNVREFFRLYIQWYTFFWTINVAALAFLTKDSLRNAEIIAWLFVALNLLACGVCFFVWKAASTANDEATTIAASIGDASGSPFSMSIVSYACGAGALSLVANIACWWLLYLR